MILISCLVSIPFLLANPIARVQDIEPRDKPQSSAAATPQTMPPGRETSTSSSSSPLETDSTSTMLASSSGPRSTSGQTYSVAGPAGEASSSAQVVSCDRERESKTWEVNTAIKAIEELSKKKCVQIAGVRAEEFSCTRLMSYGSANVDLCAPRGYGVSCPLLASWARQVPAACSWKPQFFYHWAVTGGMYYPPEGYPEGVYVRIGRL